MKLSFFREIKISQTSHLSIFKFQSQSAYFNNNLFLLFGKISKFLILINIDCHAIKTNYKHFDCLSNKFHTISMSTSKLSIMNTEKNFRIYYSKWTKILKEIKLEEDFKKMINSNEFKRDMIHPIVLTKTSINIPRKERRV